jgi:hypothetical protein
MIATITHRAASYRHEPSRNASQLNADRQVAAIRKGDSLRTIMSDASHRYTAPCIAAHRPALRLCSTLRNSTFRRAPQLNERPSGRLPFTGQVSGRSVRLRHFPLRTVSYRSAPRGFALQRDLPVASTFAVLVSGRFPIAPLRHATHHPATLRFSTQRKD